jgi:hypothetical protein
MTLVFVDGDSEMELTLDGGDFSVRRPTNGLTPFLEAMIDAICDEELMGNDAANARNFLRQADEMSVLIGEERCG